MEALRTALAQLVALEARATDIVNAGEAIGTAGLQVVKAMAASMEDFHARLVALEGGEPVVEPLPIVITPGTQVETPAVEAAPIAEEPAAAGTQDAPAA